MNKLTKYSIITLIFLKAFTSGNLYAQQLVFNKTYGSGLFNYGKGVIQNNDKSFYILANESNLIGNTSIHIIKTDSAGSIIFDKKIGEETIYYAEDFRKTPDNGLIITGFTNLNIENGYDVLLIKTDSSANIEWLKTYGGSDWDMGKAVIYTTDSSFLIAGRTYSYGPANENIYLIKTNFNGDTLWTKIFGGDSSDYATCIDNAAGNNYYIGANTNSLGNGDYDALILKLNSNGDTIWTAIQGDTLEDLVYSIRETPDSGYIFAGATENFGAIYHDTWVMRFDKNNTQMWSLPQPWTIGSKEDYTLCVNLVDSNRFVFCGYTTSAGFGGNEISFSIWNEYLSFMCSYGAGSDKNDEAVYVTQTIDKGFVTVGTTEGLGPFNTNIFLMKTTANCMKAVSFEQEIGIEDNIQNSGENILIYPSVSAGIFNIFIPDKNKYPSTGIVVYDIQGRIVYSGEINSTSNTTTIDLTNHKEGFYILSVFNNNFSISRKIIILK